MKNRIKILLLAGVTAFSGIFPWAARADGYPMQPVTFPEYLARVASDNLEYLAERLNIDIAQAEIAVQKILPDPELYFEAADETFSLELSYTVETGKRHRRIDYARTEAEMERLALEWFFQELRAEAADAFLEAMLQKELLRVKEDSYEYMAQLYRYDSMRCRLGEIAENEARQTLIEAATLQNEVYRQQGEYLASLSELNLFMGSDSGLLFDPQGSWDSIGSGYDLNLLTDRAMDSRIDLMAANTGAELALKNIKLVKAERRPDLGVMIGYDRGWGGFWPKRDMVKAGISVPLQFSNINKGALRQSRYMAAQEEARVRSLELEVRTEIAQAYYRYESLRKEAAQYNSGLLEEARLLLDGMTFRYRRGEIDILELLIAQRTYNEVREQYLETMKEYASAAVALNRSAGIWDIGF